MRLSGGTAFQKTAIVHTVKWENNVPDIVVEQY